MHVSVTRLSWRASKILLVGRGQLAVLRDAHVVIVRDEIEHVFFEVGAGAADGVHLAAADHLGQRKPNSAVLIAPASVTSMWPPEARWAR